MKLVIQIPCLNEEGALPGTLADLPKRIDGIDEIAILIIDDGSTDRTVEVAKAHGAAKVVSFTSNQGLSKAFAAGLDEALRMGADIIVNTDADNQYPGASVADLVRPILEGRADIVVGDRQTATLSHFSPTKKLLQRLGSWVVRKVSGTTVPDATSGFRAFSREAALRINIVSPFSYTLETIIQAGKKGLAVASVPIAANRVERPSRLFRSNWSFVKNQSATILRVTVMYEPLKTFAYLSLVPFLMGTGLGVRFLWSYFTTDSPGKVQSMIVAAVLFMLSFLLMVLGIIADLIYGSRRLVEESLYRSRKQELAESRRDKPSARP